MRLFQKSQQQKLNQPFQKNQNPNNQVNKRERKAKKPQSNRNRLIRKETKVQSKKVKGKQKLNDYFK